jgi:hypothetical protein
LTGHPLHQAVIEILQQATIILPVETQCDSVASTCTLGLILRGNEGLFHALKDKRLRVEVHLVVRPHGGRY